MQLTLVSIMQEEERKGGKKGRLLGIITLSDVLRYIIGESAIGESAEPPQDIDSGIRTPSSGPTLVETEEIIPKVEEPPQPAEGTS